MKLKIEGYGPHIDTTIDISEGVHRAPSGAGKTSSVHALCWLLWGCAPTGGRALPLWHEQCSVTLEAKSVLSRRRSASGSITRTARGQSYATEDAWRDLLGPLGTDAARLVVAPMAWLDLYQRTADGRHLRDAILSVVLPDHAALAAAVQEAEQQRRNATRALDRADGAATEARDVLARAEAEAGEVDADELAAARDAVARYEAQAAAYRDSASLRAAWRRAHDAYTAASDRLARWEATPTPARPDVPHDVVSWSVAHHDHQSNRPCSGRCPGATAKTQCARAAGDTDALARWEAEADRIGARCPAGATLLPEADARRMADAWREHDRASMMRGPRPVVPEDPGPEPPVVLAPESPTEARALLARHDAAAGVLAYRARRDQAEAALALARADADAASRAVEEARSAPARAWDDVRAMLAPLAEQGVNVDVTEDRCVVTYRDRPIEVASTGERIAADMAWRMWWRDVTRTHRLPILVDEAQSSTLLPPDPPAGVVYLVTAPG